jgi:NosR/NirI family transcriptional regulator, nitrous oxide reductase regulator
LLIPVLVWIGSGTGGLLREPLSRMHPTVRLAERIASEELGRYKGVTLESAVFRASDTPNEKLYAAAVTLKEGFGRGGKWFGALMGFVIGCKLIAVSILRKRTDYEPDRGTCLSCGRCFKYCPVKRPAQGGFAGPTLDTAEFRQYWMRVKPELRAYSPVDPAYEERIWKRKQNLNNGRCWP